MASRDASARPSQSRRADASKGSQATVSQFEAREASAAAKVRIVIRVCALITIIGGLVVYSGANPLFVIGSVLLGLASLVSDIKDLRIARNRLSQIARDESVPPHRDRKARSSTEEESPAGTEQSELSEIRAWRQARERSGSEQEYHTLRPERHEDDR
jgi:hypothetical protein